MLIRQRAALHSIDSIVKSEIEFNFNIKDFQLLFGKMIGERVWIAIAISECVPCSCRWRERRRRPANGRCSRAGADRNGA